MRDGLDWDLLLNERDWSLDVEDWWSDDLRLGEKRLGSSDAKGWVDELIVGCWADSLKSWWLVETSFWSLDVDDWGSLNSDWQLLVLDLLQELLNLVESVLDLVGLLKINIGR